MNTLITVLLVAAMAAASPNHTGDECPPFTPDSPLATAVEPSCNFKLRKGQPVAVVLHFTEGSTQAAVNEFKRPGSTSAHYIVSKNGDIVQVVPEMYAAFHVVQTGSDYCRRPEICSVNGGDLASSTIGIELENYGYLIAASDGYYCNGFGYGTNDPFIWTGSPYEHRGAHWDKYPQTQLRALQALLDDIRARNPGVRLLAGHQELQQKNDPGPALLDFMAKARPVFEAPADEPANIFIGFWKYVMQSLGKK